MRITIVSGFFLPIPPVAGGATEKTWYQLARRFAARGHQVTIISRRWPGMADKETVDGIHYRRVPGHNHRARLWQNLALDFLWSWRVFFALPPADIVIVNAVALPVWLSRLKSAAGRVVVLVGRTPKGQYRWYPRLARVLVPSSIVLKQTVAENPKLAPVCRISGYPIAADALRRESAPPPAVLTLGYVGRLHEEKGLRLLAAALRLVAVTPDLPPWRMVLCGPEDVARGGSGLEFRGEIEQTLRAFLPAEAVTFLAPQFDDAALARVYQSIDLFCYPSQAEQGETFGVAIAEAMAAGAVPVVSQLACFTDFVQDGANGLVFEHRAADAPARLAAALVRLLREPDLRRQLATAATATAQHYDYGAFADNLLADFAQLTGSAQPASSAP
jgi:glycosyltransferase involved in cell wall biosynthesis